MVNSMIIIIIIGLVLFVSLSYSSCIVSSLPNIVLILADDSGWGDLGLNWKFNSDSPYLDSLALKGIRLTDFHSGASICTPSRAAILTGRLGLRTGVTTNFWETSLGGLPTNETIISEYLKQLNYATAIHGKWHLGHNPPYHPSFRGFDEYYGVPYSVDMGCLDDVGYNRPMEKPCPKDQFNNYYTKSKFNKNKNTIQYTESELLDIDNYLESDFNLNKPPLFHETQDPPVHLQIEHDFPYFDQRRPSHHNDNEFSDYKFFKEPNVALPFYNSYPNCSNHSCNKDIVAQPLSLSTLTQEYIYRDVSFIKNSVLNNKPFFLYAPLSHMHVPLETAPQFFNSSNSKTRYGDALREVDYHVQMIIEALESSGVANNTLVIYTSDNGGWNQKCEYAGSSGPYLGLWQITSGGGGGTAKFTTWEAAHRVPFIAYWPGVIQAGIVNNALTSAMDILPTILSLTGLPLPTDRLLDGLDLSPILFSNASSIRTTLIHPDAAGKLTSLRYNHYKAYFRTYSAPSCGNKLGKSIKHSIPLIFDLNLDPAESTPIIPPKHIYDELYKAVAHKYLEVAATAKSQVDWKDGGLLARACCNPLHVVCRCEN